MDTKAIATEHTFTGSDGATVITKWFDRREDATAWVESHAMADKARVAPGGPLGKFRAWARYEGV